MKLSFVRVTDWHQALDLLNVRNQCREGMTHAIEEISEQQQERFFAEQIVPGHTYECYLLYDGAEAAGYGLLKRDGHKKWMTAGLARAYRGRHLSRLLINQITEIAYADNAVEVWIDVYDDNRALIGDLRCGYQLVRTEVTDAGRLLRIMRHHRDRDLGLDEIRLLNEARARQAHIGLDPLNAADELAELHEVDAISRQFYPR
jgi:hypothetical protein